MAIVRSQLLGLTVLLASGIAAFTGHGWLAVLCAFFAGILLTALLRQGPAEQETGYRKTSEDRDWQAEALSNTLDAISEGVILLNRQDRVLACNTVAKRLLNLPEGGLADRHVGDLIDWPQLLTALQQARTDGSSTQFEARQGSDQNVQTMSVHLLVAGNGQAVVVLRDITRLRQLESYRRDFVANVSHELKTPLAAIQGFVETLIDDPDVPANRRQHFLQRVQRQVSRLGLLVADLLTVSRLDESRPLPTAPCDLVAVVSEVERDMQPMAEAKGVSLQVALPAPPVHVVAEHEALRQVVSNLIDNALKYTPEGSVSVSLKCHGTSCTLQVQDTGIGMSKPDQHRVFERFYRVDKARSTELGGTGLGLSIVKNSVQSMGGEIGVESQLGEGSRFWVRLPARQRISTLGN